MFLFGHDNGLATLAESKILRLLFIGREADFAS
jgi:hypothetical protein